MLNKILCLLVALCMGQAAAAQENNEARQLLDRVADTFRQAEGVEIAFEVRAPEGTSEGRIRLKGEKFRLDTEGITTWFDGRTQWTYLENSDEVNVSEPTAEELQSINPYAWLSLYKNGYTLKMGEQADPRLHKVMMTATPGQRAAVPDPLRRQADLASGKAEPCPQGRPRGSCRTGAFLSDGAEIRRCAFHLRQAGLSDGGGDRSEMNET